MRDFMQTLAMIVYNLAVAILTVLTWHSIISTKMHIVILLIIVILYLITTFLIDSYFKRR